MADKKISQLDAAGALTGAELVPAVQTGETVRTTTQDVADLYPISTLTAASTPLAGTEIMPLVQSGNKRRATAQDVADLYPISTLTAASTPLAGTEIVPLVQSGNKRRATAQDIANLFPIASLGAATTPLAGTELVPISQGGTKVRATVTDIRGSSSGGVGPLYVAKWEKNFVAASSGQFISFTDPVTEVQTCVDVAFNSGLGFLLWRLNEGMYIANVHASFQAAGGTGPPDVGVNFAEVTTTFARFPRSSNTSFYDLFHVTPIASDNNRTNYSIAATAIISSPGQDDGFFVDCSFNWGDTTVNISTYGFLVLTKISSTAIPMEF